jgi:hypothetical protein
MPREGAIIFSDLIGKLDVLRIECAKQVGIATGLPSSTCASSA